MDETTHYIITYTVLITVVYMLSSSSVDTRTVMIPVLWLMCHPKIVIYKWVSLQSPARRRLGELHKKMQSDCFSFSFFKWLHKHVTTTKNHPWSPSFTIPHCFFFFPQSLSLWDFMYSICCSCSRYRCGSGIRKKSTFRLVKISIVTPKSSVQPEQWWY